MNTPGWPELASLLELGRTVPGSANDDGRVRFLDAFPEHVLRLVPQSLLIEDRYARWLDVVGEIRRHAVAVPAFELIRKPTPPVRAIDIGGVMIVERVRGRTVRDQLGAGDASA